MLSTGKARGGQEGCAKCAAAKRGPAAAPCLCKLSAGAPLCVGTGASSACTHPSLPAGLRRSPMDLPGTQASTSSPGTAGCWGNPPPASGSLAQSLVGGEVGGWLAGWLARWVTGWVRTWLAPSQARVIHVCPVGPRPVARRTPARRTPARPAASPSQPPACGQAAVLCPLMRRSPMLCCVAECSPPPQPRPPPPATMPPATSADLPPPPPPPADHQSRTPWASGVIV